MRIKITVDLPLEKDVKPPIGSIHEVTRMGRKGKSLLYYFVFTDTEIAVYPHECEVIDNG